MRGIGEKKLRWLKGFIRASLLIFLIIFSSYYILDRRIRVPYFYISLEMFILFVLLMVVSKRSPAFKAFLFHVAVFFLTIGIMEAYWANWFFGSRHDRLKPNTYEGEFFKGNYCVPDDIRGYCAKKNIKARARVLSDKVVCYDVVYTINRHGLRISPHDVPGPYTATGGGYENVVFFGGSNTVGEGVQDDETMPWLFESLSKGRYRSYNFGFHGYGPHQMLRILESGLMDEVITDRPPAKAVYQGLMEHIERSAGNYPALLWSPCSPKYVLRDSGQLEYGGPFCGKKSETIFKLLLQSHIVKRTAPSILGWKRTQRDIELFVEIIKKSREVFEKKYEGEFSVLLWGTFDKDYPDVLARLKKENIAVFESKEIIPDFYAADKKYKVKGDEHPNKTANEIIARFLLKKL